MYVHIRYVCIYLFMYVCILMAASQIHLNPSTYTDSHIHTSCMQVWIEAASRTLMTNLNQWPVARAHTHTHTHAYTSIHHACRYGLKRRHVLSWPILINGPWEEHTHTHTHMHTHTYTCMQVWIEAASRTLMTNLNQGPVGRAYAFAIATQRLLGRRPKDTRTVERQRGEETSWECLCMHVCVYAFICMHVCLYVCMYICTVERQRGEKTNK